MFVFEVALGLGFIGLTIGMVAAMLTDRRSPL
jgi:hypothetical protein